MARHNWTRVHARHKGTSYGYRALCPVSIGCGRNCGVCPSSLVTRHIDNEPLFCLVTIYICCTPLLRPQAKQRFSVCVARHKGTRAHVTRPQPGGPLTLSGHLWERKIHQCDTRNSCGSIQHQTSSNWEKWVDLSHLLWISKYSFNTKIIDTLCCCCCCCCFLKVLCLFVLRSYGFVSRKTLWFHRIYSWPWK